MFFLVYLFDFYLGNLKKSRGSNMFSDLVIYEIIKCVVTIKKKSLTLLSKLQCSNDGTFGIENMMAR